MKVQLIINRRAGYIHYHGPDMARAQEKWARWGKDKNVSWYEVPVMEFAK